MGGACQLVRLPPPHFPPPPPPPPHCPRHCPERRGLGAPPCQRQRQLGAALQRAWTRLQQEACRQWQQQQQQQQKQQRLLLLLLYCQPPPHHLQRWAQLRRCHPAECPPAAEKRGQREWGWWAGLHHPHRRGLERGTLMPRAAGAHHTRRPPWAECWQRPRQRLLLPRPLPLPLPLPLLQCQRRQGAAPPPPAGPCALGRKRGAPWACPPQHQRHLCQCQCSCCCCWSCYCP